jgi:two-component sensor histidine kinase/CheY-like chemotaxis protein
LEAALNDQTWDIIIADYSMPQFDGLAALQIVKKRGYDVPFICVSGTIGETIAVNVMKEGAHDYIMKAKIALLPPAVKRELKEVKIRRERKNALEALRLSERNLSIRNQIANVFLTCPEGKIYESVLQIILKAMKSEYGLFGYINEEGNLVCASMGRDIWDESQAPGKDYVFLRKKWRGMWNCTLKEKKTFLSNKPFLIPNGHVPFTRALSVPILHKGKLVGNLLVGNKTEDYTKDEQQLMEAIAGYIAPVLLARLQRDKQEKARRKAEDEIKASLREKEVMLKEIHHRVKNNMQIITSLLRLQSRSLENQEAKDILTVSSNRIKSMALIHDALYRSKDLSRIDFSEYTTKVVNHLFSVYQQNAAQISAKLDVGEIFLDVNRAIPCGQIINELAVNALLHAFPSDEKGEICVKLNVSDKGKINVIVADNGVGFPDALDFRSTDTLGLQIVNDLVAQLKGAIEMSREGGTEFKITF